MSADFELVAPEPAAAVEPLRVYRVTVERSCEVDALVVAASEEDAERLVEKALEDDEDFFDGVGYEVTGSAWRSAVWISGQPIPTTSLRSSRPLFADGEWTDEASFFRKMVEGERDENRRLADEIAVDVKQRREKDGTQ